MDGRENFHTENQLPSGSLDTSLQLEWRRVTRSVWTLRKPLLAAKEGRIHAPLFL
jgi:hypothetical protein